MNKQELEDQLEHFKREARANQILLDRERKASMARTDADFARKSQKYKEDKAKMQASARPKAKPKPKKTAKR